MVGLGICLAKKPQGARVRKVVNVSYMAPEDSFGTNREAG